MYSIDDNKDENFDIAFLEILGISIVKFVGLITSYLE